VAPSRRHRPELPDSRWALEASGKWMWTRLGLSRRREGIEMLAEQTLKLKVRGHARTRVHPADTVRARPNGRKDLVPYDSLEVKW
jgi:hypothetical protein